MPQIEIFFDLWHIFIKRVEKDGVFKNEKKLKFRKWMVE